MLVLSYLNCHELALISSCSKQLYYLSDLAWREMCIRQFGIKTNTIFQASEAIPPDQEDNPPVTTSQRTSINNQVFTIDWKEYYYLRRELLKPTSFHWVKTSLKSGPFPSERMAHSAVIISVRSQNNKMNGRELGREMKEMKYIAYIGGQVNDKDRFDEVFLLSLDHGPSGGSNKHRMHLLNQSEYVPLNFTKVNFSPNAHPPKFSRHSSVIIEGKVYTFGGFDGTSKYFGLAVYDPERSVWENPKTFGNIPIPRTNHAAAAIGSKMYIYGGNYSSSLDDDYQVLDDLHVLDTRTMTWSQLKTQGRNPGPRTAHALIAVRGKLFLFGGGIWVPKPQNKWVKKFNDVHMFDIETCEWILLETKGTIPVCSFPLSFVLDNWICFFGGQSLDEDCVTDQIHCFDTLTYSCHELQTELFKGRKPKSRDLGTATVFGQFVYIFGGSSGIPVKDMDILHWNAKSTYLQKYCCYRKRNRTHDSSDHGRDMSDPGGDNSGHRDINQNNNDRTSSTTTTTTTTTSSSNGNTNTNDAIENNDNRNNHSKNHNGVSKISKGKHSHKRVVNKNGKKDSSRKENYYGHVQHTNSINKEIAGDDLNICSTGKRSGINNDNIVMNTHNENSITRSGDCVKNNYCPMMTQFNENTSSTEEKERSYSNFSSVIPVDKESQQIKLGGVLITPFENYSPSILNRRAVERIQNEIGDENDWIFIE